MSSFRGRNMPNIGAEKSPDGLGKAVRARRGLTIAIGLIVTALLWLFAQWLGGRGIISLRYMVLLDLIALASFFALMCNVLWLWRRAKG